MKKTKSAQKKNSTGEMEESKNDTESLVQKNLEFQKEFNNFIGDSLESRNTFIKLYSKIVNNPNYLKELNYDPKQRLYSLVEYSIRKQRTDKESLNNILISKVNKVNGIFHCNLDRRLYLVEAKMKSEERNNVENIFVNENLFLNKQGRKEEYVDIPCLDLSDNVDEYKFP